MHQSKYSIGKLLPASIQFLEPSIIVLKLWRINSYPSMHYLFEVFLRSIFHLKKTVIGTSVSRCGRGNIPHPCSGLPNIRGLIILFLAKALLKLEVSAGTFCPLQAE